MALNLAHESYDKARQAVFAGEVGRGVWRSCPLPTRLTLSGRFELLIVHTLLQGGEGLLALSGE